MLPVLYKNNATTFKLVRPMSDYELPLTSAGCGVAVRRVKDCKKLYHTYIPPVILLDEADLLLEEQDMKYLNRNALVSVFCAQSNTTMASSS